ncbi:GNAT family N-acetyltransferase [Ovoidimarina sediminis]|uniref:GNAT family N-acetyltransferase n=1 Tax=Ovoidimarina sediminis TaxID=3079856 RepID=UPI003977D373
MLPPKGRLAIARAVDGRLLGCGSLRRIRSDAVEMKRMFVRPEAQGQGLGKGLFDMRLEEARNMGCRAVYADTAKVIAPCCQSMNGLASNIFRAIPKTPTRPSLNPIWFTSSITFDDNRGETETGASQCGRRKTSLFASRAQGPTWRRSDYSRSGHSRA